MTQAHKIPTDLAPAGTICVPVLLPHDEEWVALFIGAIRQLEKEAYYGYGIDLVPDVKTLVNTFRDLTITPLIDSLEDMDDLCVGGDSMPFVGCKVYRSAAFTVPANVSTPISWDTEAWDTDDFWAIGNPTKIIIPAGFAGKYAIAGGGVFDTKNSRKAISIFQNTNLIASEEGTFVGYFAGTSYVEADLAVGDAITLQAFTTVATNLVTIFPYNFLSVRKVD